MTLSRNLIFLIVAVVLLLVYALAGFEVISGLSHPFGWLGLGLASFAAAHI